MNKRTTLRLATLLLAFLVNNVFSASEKNDTSLDTLADLKAAVERARQEYEVPAVGIAMVDENGPVWIGSLGLADLGKEVPADESTIYRIGSVSKMFVSLAVLKLVEEGRLSLDDRLAELAPEIAYENPWEESDPVRIVHLLEHTTGWDDLHITEYAHSDPTPSTLKQGLDFHPHSRKSRWKPGTRMAYCNAGPGVAAYIVQKITGQEFESYVDEQFFQPMGMKTAGYRLSGLFKQRGATLYTNGEPSDYWHISMRPSGAINASPVDMAQLVSFFLNRGSANGQSLISTASLERMEHSSSTNGARAGLELGYGLSNFAKPYKHWVYWGHNGAVNGSLAQLSYLPEAKAGHTIMINSHNPEALKAISELVRGYETRNLQPPALDTETAPLSSLTTIEGLYIPISPRVQQTHFFSRFLGLQSLRLDGNRIALKPFLSDVEPKYYYAAGENLFRPEALSHAGLAITSDPLVGDVVQVGMRTYQQVNSLMAYGLLGVGAMWGAVMVSTLLFFPIWGVRKLRGKVPAGLPTQVRLWPLLSSLAFVTFLVLAVIGSRNFIGHLGAPGPVSVGIMMSTVLFAVLTVIGLYSVYRARHIAMNRMAYWHSTLASVLHGTALLYLLYFGVIGVRTWS